MSFKVTNKPHCSVIQSEVEKLDALTVPELKDIITDLNERNINRIIIDLSKTAYCNSSGLSIIITANRNCKNGNGKFILTGLQPNVKKIIEIAQLHRIFLITDSLEQADKSMY